MYALHINSVSEQSLRSSILQVPDLTRMAHSYERAILTDW